MPFFLIWYMIAVLPFLIFIEGYKKLKEHIPEKNPLWRIPYILLIVFGIILVILLLSGYR